MVVEADKLLKFMNEWLDDTARKTRAVGSEDPRTEPRIEGMTFAVNAITEWVNKNAS